MAEAMGKIHLKYIDEYLIPEIVHKLKNETLVTYEVEHAGGLDGFMSALYNIVLKTTTETGSKERRLIGKFMKGDNTFREGSKSYIQFANEIFVYDKVIPAYAKILDEANVKDVAVNNWIAPVYAAKFGYIEGLSATPTERESVLVLENLKPLGYTLGPRLYLNRDHLLGMCKPLGEYHALSYALRLRNVSQLEELKAGIIPLPFINQDPEDEKNNLYRILYRCGFDRFFDYFDRIIDGNTFDKSNAGDVNLIDRLQKLHEKYFAEPTRLLEHIRTKVESCEEDRRFGAILHGDFNRNNVLFRYKAKDQQRGEEKQLDKVLDVKMIDFQELRYGSPAIDLSFCLYMNTAESIRDEAWLDILRAYHGTMFTTLASIVKDKQLNEVELQKIETELENYNFDNFYAHFSRFAFYGVMICIHFLPWILCSEEECARLSHLFESDMHGEEFRKLSIEAGGDAVNFKILQILRHACKMGYMDHI